MKKRMLVVGLIICILFVATVLLSPNCRHAKRQQIHHEENYATVTSIVQTTSNNNQVNGQKTASYTLSKEVNKALEHGAKAKVTFKVVDSNGNSVSGARVHVHFTFYNRDKNEVVGVTDSSGMFTAEKETTLSFKWNIQKEGYYTTNGKRFLTDGLSNDSVKNGCWQPWNPIIKVVLKEKRKPAEMAFKVVEISMPAYDKPIGFDFGVGDWVAPHGKGVYNDVAFQMQDEYIDRSNKGQMFRIIFPSANDGLIRLPMDFSSKMPSLYEAPKEGYQKEIISTWSVKNGRMIEDSRIKQDEYLIFRYRTNVDEYGNVKGAHYGKLYGPFEYSFGVAHKRRLYFAYYLNPTIDDRNLEAAGEHP